MAGRGDLIELSGDKALAKALIYMSDASAIRIMRPAISKGLTIAKREAKSLVKKRSGALGRAIAARARGNRHKGTVTGVLYVKRGKSIMYKGRKHDPAKIAHLVEFGTRHSKAKPFMRAALGNKRSQIQAAITMKAIENHEKEARKAALRGRSL